MSYDQSSSSIKLFAHRRCKTMLLPSCLILKKCFALQDSALHRGKEGKDYLKRIFSGRCIASEGPILWLAQSPDDDPTRYVKNMAYQGNLNKMEEPERYTADNVAEVDASMLEGTWRGIIDFLWSGQQTG
jgi:hypothetical protein